jgi:hypothetical protein
LWVTRQSATSFQKQIVEPLIKLSAELAFGKGAGDFVVGQ